jgi:hypothetical protein
LDFAARFGTEERCIEHLAELRWPGGFVCSGCGGRAAWRLKARPRVYECGTCHRQESVTAGTVFHRTRTDLSKWFLAAYLMGRDKRGVSAKFLQRELDRGARRLSGYQAPGFRQRLPPCMRNQNLGATGSNADYQRRRVDKAAGVAAIGPRNALERRFPGGPHIVTADPVARLSVRSRQPGPRKPVEALL